MIYLDNSATTQPFDSVIGTMTRAMAQDYFNPSAVYGPAVLLDRRIRNVREQIAAALGDPGARVIFTGSGTESNNLALRGLLPSLKQPGHFITTAMEHPSVLRVAEQLQTLGHRVDILPVSRQGRVDPDELAALLREDTTLVSVMQVNNETGAMQDLAALGERIRRLAPRCLFHVDGVQGFMREPVSLTECRIDLYSLSGHKIHGPKGVGALVAAGRTGKVLSPVLLGGGQEQGLRSGTVNGPAILALGQAIGEFTAHTPRWREQMAELKLRLLEEVNRGVEGVHVNGPAPQDAAGHILNLAFEGVRGEVLLHGLEGEGVLVSTGSACSSHAARVSPGLLAQGVSSERAQGAIRISLSALTTAEEIDRAAEIICRQVQRLRRFKRR